MKYLILIFLFSVNIYAKKNKTTVVSAEEMALIEKEMQKQNSTPTKDSQSKKVGGHPVYVPAPVVDNVIDQKGYMIERDSNKIVNLKIKPNDFVNILICNSNPVHIAFDKDYNELIQTPILDGNTQDFEALPFENYKGVYVRLKEPIAGAIKQSNLRLILKSNDKALMFKLIGIPCPPKGLNPYPTTYYISEKESSISSNSKVYTPEDFIYISSNAYKRKNMSISLRDMFASAHSDWVVFSLQLKIPEGMEQDNYKFEFKILDSFQISMIQSKTEYLQSVSEEVTSASDMTTLRYKLSVMINKRYMIDNKYIWLMVLDHNKKEYVYELVDLEPYYKSLIDRGVNL